jgi:hypothetical protein
MTSVEMEGKGGACSDELILRRDIALVVDAEDLARVERRAEGSEADGAKELDSVVRERTRVVTFEVEESGSEGVV